MTVNTETKTKATALFGPSVCVEEHLTLLLGNLTGQKQSVTGEFFLGGSSANAAMAMKSLGGDPHLIALIGPKDDHYTHILNALTKRADVGVRHYFEALKKTSYSKVIITPGEKYSPILGERGHLKSNLSQVSKILEEFTNGGFTAMTSIQEEEAHLARTLLSKTKEGKRFLHIHGTFCGNPSVAHVAKFADIMAMNEVEFNKCGCNLSLLHDMGPKAIIVTQAENGGFCSFEGNRFRYDPVLEYDGQFCSDVGAGDYFNGALIHAISARGWDANSLRDQSCFHEVVKVAADAAAQKVAFGKIIHNNVL